MRPPAFWFSSPDRPSWQAKLLSPVAGLVAQKTARRVRQTGYKAQVPVICIGNLNLGGTGKTPTVIALMERLYGLNRHVHVVSRGYGGALTGPVRVNERNHSAQEVGDEPLLIAAFGPTWVAKDRAAGVQAAEAAGAEIILLDDGHQNPSVQKDLSIVVIDAGVGFGNGRVAPAGPLREPVAAGFQRADAAMLIGPTVQQTRCLGIWGHAINVPVLRATLDPLRTGMEWGGTRVLAFAGIGRPQKFFATLRGLGAILVKTQALDDHQALTDPLMKRLELEAMALNAQLVTTEKDAVRLPPGFRQKVITVPVRLNVEDWTPLDALLNQL